MTPQLVDRLAAALKDYRFWITKPRVDFPKELLVLADEALADYDAARQQAIAPFDAAAESAFREEHRPKFEAWFRSEMIAKHGYDEVQVRMSLLRDTNGNYTHATQTKFLGYLDSRRPAASDSQRREG